MAGLKHFLEYEGYSPKEVLGIIRTALRFKKYGYRGRKALSGRVIALIFQKPSTRTRVSFQSSIARLGGESIYLGWGEIQPGQRESIMDISRVMSRYVHAIVARVNRHETIEEMARNSGVPVINALSDKHHPCQALADIMTVMQFKRRLEGVKIAYVGDGNNVCNSLIQICSLLGVNLSVATPREYRPDENVVRRALMWAEKSKAEISIVEEPEEAVRDADFVYTDVFISMGQEEERERRLQIFLPKYQVNKELMEKAKPDAKFMHCMPMHIGEEVTEDVAYGSRSVIYEQAENRMHTEAALLLHLLKGRV